MPPTPQLIRELFVSDFEEYSAYLDERQGPLHVHHFWQMDLYLAGHSTLILSNERRDFEGAGALVLLPPLLWHAYEVHPGHRRLTFKLALSPYYLSRTRRQLCLTTVPGPLLGMVESMSQWSADGDDLASAEKFATATLCLTQALRATEATTQTVPMEALFEAQVEMLIEEIASRPCNPWSVAQLAQRCHMTADHFTRRFTALVEQTPQRLLLEMRMQAAATALLAPNPSSVKQVAELVGYASVHAFTRAFRRVFGVPPATFRRLQGRR